MSPFFCILERMPSQTETIFCIQDLSSKGRGLAKDDRIEVIGALPGEEVLVQLGGCQKRKRQAFLRKVITPSEDRVPARCAHAPACGGCAFQHLDYSAQLAWKQRNVEALFADLGVGVEPVIPCAEPWRYRNKMEFSFSEDKKGEKFLGLILAGTRGRVTNISDCLLVSPWQGEVLQATRDWWHKEGLNAYHHNSDRGTLRNLILREAKREKGKMVILVVSGNPDFAMQKSQIKSFVEAIRSVYDDPELSIFLRIQQIAKGSPTQLFEMVIHGPDHITEKLHIEVAGESQTLQCKISPTSFFQPNTLQAEALYEEALSMVSLEGKRVFDLYCGSGTIGLSAARLAKEVVGIEINPHAVFDAGWNQEVNEIDNFTIHRGDVGEVLTTLSKDPKFTPPDVAIIDPPRSGLDARAIQQLTSLQPKSILYISCNPKTQVENIVALVEEGYTCERVLPVDQFPHTVHIECITHIKRN